MTRRAAAAIGVCTQLVFGNTEVVFRARNSRRVCDRRLFLLRRLRGTHSTGSR
ncbi:MAG TPA: hypothetical protein VFR38_16265 [Gaiellaceae bacterium]|nr:hypothetical protein [Gaiellaceae bacterium]